MDIVKTNQITIKIRQSFYLHTKSMLVVGRVRSGKQGVAAPQAVLGGYKSKSTHIACFIKLHLSQCHSDMPKRPLGYQCQVYPANDQLVEFCYICYITNNSEEMSILE